MKVNTASSSWKSRFQCTAGMLRRNRLCAALCVMVTAALVILQPASAQCTGDLNDSGSVGVLDLLILLDNWGTCPAPPVACPTSDHNCFSTGAAGCTDETCCDLVCAQDPFCCQTAWDSACVNQANMLCIGCGNANAGDCCSDNGTPHCENRACCDAICVLDPFCCTSEWDTLCADGAQSVADCDCEPPVTCPTSDHNCFSTGAAGCTDETCCDLICAQDPFCCQTAWDSACVNQTNMLCIGCGNANAGDCCSDNGTPHCENRACCDAICVLDPFCCTSEWDTLCADGAQSVADCNC